MPVTAATMESHRRVALAVSQPLQNAVVTLNGLVENAMQRESHQIIADEALSIDASARKAVVAGQLGELSALWTQIVNLVQSGSTALAAAEADIANWINENGEQE